jgi:hypothetical protein
MGQSLSGKGLNGDFVDSMIWGMGRKMKRISENAKHLREPLSGGRVGG